jgi:hypothetical protein
MLNFKEWFIINELAKPNNVAVLNKTITNLQKTYNLYKQLVEFTSIGKNGKWITESNQEDDEEYLNDAELNKFFARNKKFLDHMEKNYGAKPRIHKGWFEKHATGNEGVAFFFQNNIIAKVCFLNSTTKEMFQVACKLKGKLHLVPVIDCFRVQFSTKDEWTNKEYKNLLKPVIVMKQIDADSPRYDETIKSTYDKLSKYLETLVHNLQQNKLQNPDQEIQTAMTIAGIKSKDVELNADEEKIAEDFFVIMREIYHQTGYVLGGDMKSAKNIGLDRDTNKLMPFDLGLGHLHKPTKFNEPPTLEF